MTSSNTCPTDSPLRGPTLSTSTSSFEAFDPHDPNLSRLATKMFKTAEEYITSEMQGPIDDYKLLEQMNKVTFAKYSDMQQIADNLVVSTTELNNKLNALEPFMEQIDDIEATVEKLEAAVYKLDAYSLSLETKFKALMQKRS